jgi:hypothetical protein
MVDHNKIQQACQKIYADSVSSAVSNAVSSAKVIDAANAEFQHFSDFAMNVGQSKDANETLNHVITYNALLFSRALGSVAKATEQMNEHALQIKKELKEIWA